MSDNAFINAYVDNAIGTIFEHVRTNLQLKTQLKVTGDLLAEKEAIITNLINEIEQHKQALINSSGFAEEINALRQEKSALENVIAGQKGKLSHMDTLLKQLSDTEKKLAESEEALQLYLKPKKSKKISKVSINTENDF